MNPVDLHFTGARAAPTGNAVDLGFGTTTGPELPPVSGQWRTQLPAPTLAITATYTLDLSRKLIGHTGLPWRPGTPKTADPNPAVWHQSRRQVERVACTVAASAVQAAPTGMPFQTNRHQLHTDQLGWMASRSVQDQWQAYYQRMETRQALHVADWATAQGCRTALGEHFVFLKPLPQHTHLPWAWGDLAAWLHQGVFAHAQAFERVLGLPWQRAREPGPGESQLLEPPGPPPVVRITHPLLGFRCPSVQAGQQWLPWLQLRFTNRSCIPAAGIVIPVRRVYVVSNQVEVVRLPGREVLPVRSLELSLDADSWAWRFSANVAATALEMVAPTAAGPVEIEILVNGVRWIMLVEAYDLAQRFGESSLSIRGRSLAAYLAEPYAPQRSWVPETPMTARQLAEQELTRAGLVTGFTLDWQLPDWLVPAGAWSYEAQTPLGVISQIVASVAGIVQADPLQKRLVTASRYPHLPWEWALLPPDLTLPLAVVQTQNLRWQEKPAFNAVYVSGERAGVVGHVRRSGSAADVVAPMVVDALITHADAARERGRAILADTGKQALVTLELPMLEAIGLVAPGKLLAIGEGSTSWRGLVRSSRIAAQWSESLSVRQTLEVERHYGQE